jgi:putative SOS response-associated peptidase YedK
MCGRYRLSRGKQIIAEHFETADWQDDWSHRYNNPWGREVQGEVWCEGRQKALFQIRRGGRG